MDKVGTYLEWLSQEYDLLGQLVDLAREKRAAILDGAGDLIVSISESEDAFLKSLMDIRTRRQTLVREAAKSGTADSQPARGFSRRVLENLSTSSIQRSLLDESLLKYEERLRELRRGVKINNVLLSDRILILHKTVEAVLTSVQPKAEYAPGDAAGKKRKVGAGSPLVLDEKV